MKNWDAATYDKVADPQAAWAVEILARADIQPHERVLDAGCGTGRVTKLVLEQSPHVVGVDADEAMVTKAREALDIPIHHQDLLELDLDGRFDVIFSCAVFHWIPDHETLFANLRRHLKPGGRLIAQCGGHGNIANVLKVVGERPGRWLYATPEDTERRLQGAGFAQAKAWLEPKPTRVPDMRTFVATVILHADPDPWPAAERVAAELDEIDYVRLNIDARA